MEQKTHVEVEKCENENTILKDFSGFKWMSFIPGKTSIEDVSVMEINSTQARFSTLILPDHYFTPTYCIQIVKSGCLRISINNKEYEMTTNQGCLISPELLIQKPDKMDNCWCYLCPASLCRNSIWISRCQQLPIFMYIRFGILVLRRCSA